MQRQDHSKTASQPSNIQAVSQQTRFHLEETASKDLELAGLNLHIGQRQILSDCLLKLCAGVHYLLVGRNGVGKSTLLKAIAERHIPGIPRNLLILLLQQNYEEYEVTQEVSVLDYVVESDEVLSDTQRKLKGEYVAQSAIAPA